MRVWGRVEGTSAADAEGTTGFAPQRTRGPIELVKGDRIDLLFHRSGGLLAAKFVRDTERRIVIQRKGRFISSVAKAEVFVLVKRDTFGEVSGDRERFIPLANWKED